MIKIFLIFLFISSSCASRTLISAIENYQREETQYNGERCPLFPSCSEYAKEEIKKNLILGFFLTMERLFIRERGDLKQKFIQVPETYLIKNRYYDPNHNSFNKASFLRDDF